LGSGWRHLSHGIGVFVDALGAADPNLTTLYNPSSPLFRDGFEVIFCTIMVGAAIVCQPHIITKSLLLRHDSDLNRYLGTGIVIQTLFFFVVVVGLYARLEFPTLQAGGQAIAPDGVVSTYLVTQFPWFIGVVVFLGLISAGMSTLEGLIQSLSIIITNDLIGNLHHLLTRRQLGDSCLFILNRVVIIGLAALSFALAYQQIVSPNLSVIIFAQLGVYAYFAAAFVPVLFGTFLRDTPTIAAIAASVTAVVVHFTLYYTGQAYFPYYQGVTVKNPGISTALGIVAAVLVGGIFYLTSRGRTAGDLVPESKPSKW
jgi:sodium/pantothenate symporter